MKFRITFRSFDKEKLKNAIDQMRVILQQFRANYECDISGSVALPTRIKKFCVLRSPHVNKDSREHFEIRVSKQFIDIITDTPAVLNALMNVELPTGVVCSVKYLSIEGLPERFVYTPEAK